MKVLIFLVTLTSLIYAGESIPVEELHNAHLDDFYFLQAGQDYRLIVRGDREGNGGNGDISQVAKRLDGINILLNREGDHEFVDVVQSLKELITTGFFVTCARKNTMNRRLDALNYQFEGDSYIVLNCKRWRRQNLRSQKTLLMHELVYLAGYDDGNYALSTSLLRFLRKR